MNWLTYTRGSIPLHRLSVILKSLQKTAAQLSEYPIYSAIYYNTPKKITWAWEKGEMKGLSELVFAKLEDSKKRTQHFAKYDKYLSPAIESSMKIINLDLANILDKELVRKYRELEEVSLPAHGFSITDIDMIDLFFEEYFQEKLMSVLPQLDKNEFARVYQTLTSSIFQSFIKQEEIDILKLALKKEVKPQDIEKLYKNYWWTKIGWEGFQSHSRKYFEKKLEELRAKRTAAKKLEKIEKDQQKIAGDRRAVIKKYKLPKSIVKWLEIIDKYSHFHDLRKEMQIKNTYAFYKILEEIARRKNYQADELEYLHGDELLGVLERGKLDHELIRKRKQAVLVLTTKKEMKTWSGGEASTKFNSLVKSDTSRKKVITGQGVSLGKVRARARVCSGSIEALQKMKKGDVLVCGMTLPDYVPAMKKAAAIVTNEGGITCHAAIISRELDIPCIVGAQNATDIIKDKEKIEVDADQGKITRL